MARKGFTPIITLLIIAGVLILGGVLYFRTPGPNLPTTKNQAPTSSVQLHVPIVSWSTQDIGSNHSTLTASSGVSIQIDVLNDAKHRARNATYAVSVNGRKVGEIGGYLSSPNFSPRSNYLAVRSMYVMGGASTSLDFGIDLVDIASSSVIEIQLPEENPPVANSSTVINHAIEIYGWNDDRLQVASFFTETDNNTDEKPYRVTSKSLWEFNPIDKKYTFLKDLPEP